MLRHEVSLWSVPLKITIANAKINDQQRCTLFPSQIIKDAWTSHPDSVATSVSAKPLRLHNVLSAMLPPAVATFELQPYQSRGNILILYILFFLTFMFASFWLYECMLQAFSQRLLLKHYSCEWLTHTKVPISTKADKLHPQYTVPYTHACEYMYNFPFYFLLTYIYCKIITFDT